MEVEIVVRGLKGEDTQGSVPALHFSVRSNQEIPIYCSCLLDSLSLLDLFFPFGEIATKIISLEGMGKCLDIEVERRYRT